MSQIPGSPRFSLALFTLAALLAACASNRIDLVQTGALGVNIVGSKWGARILEATAYGQEDRCYVSGRMRRWQYASMALHVDATVRGRDGMVLTEAQSGRLSQFRARGWAEVPFTIKLPALPPEGATVTLTVHDDAHRT